SRIDEHRRHAGNALSDITTVANAGAAGHDPNAVVSIERVNRPGRFIEQRLARRIDRHIDNRPHAEAQQDTLFYPAIHTPATGLRAVRLGGADPTCIERLSEPPE